MTQTTAGYQFRTITYLPYEAAIERVTAALKEEGFGILTEIDVQATLKEKLDAEFRRYVILGACNPHLAYQALDAELEIGLLLPCNVIIYEEGDSSTIAIVDPLSMLGIVSNPALTQIADEANTRLQRVVDSLSAQTIIR